MYGYRFTLKYTDVRLPQEKSMPAPENNVLFSRYIFGWICDFLLAQTWTIWWEQQAWPLTHGRCLCCLLPVVWRGVSSAFARGSKDVVRWVCPTPNCRDVTWTFCSTGPDKRRIAFIWAYRTERGRQIEFCANFQGRYDNDIATDRSTERYNYDGFMCECSGYFPFFFNFFEVSTDSATTWPEGKETGALTFTAFKAGVSSSNPGGPLCLLLFDVSLPALKRLICVSDWLKSLCTLFPRPKLASDCKEITKRSRGHIPPGLEFENSGSKWPGLSRTVF